jgi:hypothetical protein
VFYSNFFLGFNATFVCNLRVLDVAMIRAWSSFQHSNGGQIGGMRKKMAIELAMHPKSKKGVLNCRIVT